MYTHICIYAYAYCNGINISALKVRYTNMPYIYIYTQIECADSKLQSTIKETAALCEIAYNISTTGD